MCCSYFSSSAPCSSPALAGKAMASFLGDRTTLLCPGNDDDQWCKNIKPKKKGGGGKQRCLCDSVEMEQAGGQRLHRQQCILIRSWGALGVLDGVCLSWLAMARMRAGPGW